MAADLQRDVFLQLDRLAQALPSLGIAVSGGSDSTALLHLAAAWAQQRGVTLHAATVDHALRPEAAREAQQVAAICAELGIPHDVLRWDHGGAIHGNLMAAARAARIALLSSWAQRQGLGAVALGHTQDDQAETFMMRLARGAGVDGLSGMAAAREQNGALWLRPLLDQRRQALRDWLAAQSLGWIDDPSNDNAAFDRVRARQAIAALDLPVEQIARSARLLSEAREALADAAVRAVEGARAESGMLWLPATSLEAPAEIRHRIVSAAIRWVTGDDYAPRGSEIARLAVVLAEGGQGTLDGVLARRREGIEFIREPVAAARAVSDDIWDNRWRLVAVPSGATIRAATQDDLNQRDWRTAGLPRPAILSSPAIQCGETVILPLLDSSASASATPCRTLPDFIALLRAH